MYRAWLKGGPQVWALAYHFYLALRAAFKLPGAPTLADLCMSVIFSAPCPELRIIIAKRTTEAHIFLAYHATTVTVQTPSKVVHALVTPLKMSSFSSGWISVGCGLCLANSPHLSDLSDPPKL